MSRNHEIGHRAAYKYQAVKYFHFGVEPGTSLVLTANPWAYLSAWFSQKIAISRGGNRERFEKGKYFVEQAESFDDAAGFTKLPTKGTLIYYSMLNLVKALLSVRGVDLEVHIEHHGLSLPLGTTDEIAISSNRTGSISIFHEFCKALGYPAPAKQIVKLVAVYSQIPEIHEISFTLGHLATSKRGFLPVEVDFLVNEAKDKAFIEIRYEKKNEVRVPCNKFYRGEIKNYCSLRAADENGWVIYRSKRRKTVNTDNWPRIYKNLSAEIEEFRLSSILTRSGYRYYANLEPGPIPQLPSVLALMFFIGTIARYRPSVTEALMAGDLYPILAESVESCPRQFLYQMASQITSSVCAVPQAKI